MGQIRQILSSSNYTGELDLFSRERFRLMLVDLFTMILTSIRDCIENVLQLRYIEFYRKNKIYCKIR